MADAVKRSPLANPARRLGPRPVLLLERRDVAALMEPPDYLPAVELAFRSLAGGSASVPPPMHIGARDGSFHVKGARIELDDGEYVAVKLNGNFPANPQRGGLPTVQGTIVLCDGADGTVLAIMDSIEITRWRTAAASALAARFLARNDADRIAVCGCGEQGRAHLLLFARTLSLRSARVWDLDADKARSFARDMAASLGIDVTPVPEPAAATRPCTVIVTATSARTPFLRRDDVPAGAFVAAVGADSPDKSELAPELMARATIVVDLLAQCAEMGDLHHALEAGLVTAADVHAELGQVVAGSRRGRAGFDDVIVFDSTGTAAQDAASAVWCYRRAVAGGVGRPVALNLT
jgi:alanine dehydrogenase